MTSKGLHILLAALWLCCASIGADARVLCAGEAGADALAPARETVSVDIRHGTLADLLAALERQTPYRFSYAEEDARLCPRLTVVMRGATLGEILDAALSGTQLTYSIVSPSSVAIYRRETPQTPSAARLRHIIGVVKDDDGQPLIGAAVKVVGSQTAAVTDADGCFSLDVPRGARLQVSYIGCKTQQVATAGRTAIAVQLESAATGLGELVVTGYMKERRQHLTGAVATIDMAEIADQPGANPLTALQGRVAGVSVTADGAPGGLNTDIEVRGRTSFRQEACQPLYVIDGIMTRESVATILSADEIESIQILKDAASAAVYGAQAAGGVIIITTKRAARGEARIDFDCSVSAQTYSSPLRLLDADQWGEVYWQAYRYANGGRTPHSEIYGSGPTPRLQDYTGLGGKPVHAVSTDWMRQTYHTALIQNYSATLSKSVDNGTFSLALNAIDHDGIVRGTGFRRINTHITSDFYFPASRIRVGESLAVNNWTQTVEPAGTDEYAIRQHPAKTVYTADGSYNDAINDVLGDAPNIRRLLDAERDNVHKRWRIFGQAYIEIQPVRSLRLRSTFGLNYYDGTDKTFEPAWDRDDINKISETVDRRLDWVWANTAVWTPRLGLHHLTLLLGSEAKRATTEFVYGHGTNLAIDSRDYAYLDSATEGKTIGGGATAYAMMSYFTKANYDWRGRYLLSATLRRDASSRLAPGHRQQLFPSASAGWIVSDEPFMAPAKSWLQSLKLRVSWGITGNDIISDNASYTAYSVSLKDAGYNLTADNKTLAPGAFRTHTGNDLLQWERTRQINIGLDAALLDGRLTVVADWFRKLTDHILVEKPYIAAIGEGGYSWTAGGEMTGHGLELQLKWKDRVGEVSYSVGGNATFCSNRVTSLIPDLYYTYGGGNGVDKTLVGQPLGSWIGYRTDGLFRTQQEVDDYCRRYEVSFGSPAVGRLRYRDTNGDGRISTADRTWLGSDNPRCTAALNLTAAWHGLDLRLQAVGVARHAYNNAKGYLDFFQLCQGNHSTRLLEAAAAWQRYETTGVYDCAIPAPTTLNTNSEGETCDYYIEDGSYIRLKALTIGWTLPDRLLARLRMRSARVYLTATNLLTLTRYQGADPEGLGYPYPQPKTVAVGVKVGF